MRDYDKVLEPYLILRVSCIRGYYGSVRRSSSRQRRNHLSKVTGRETVRRYLEKLDMTGCFRDEKNIKWRGQGYLRTDFIRAFVEFDLRRNAAGSRARQIKLQHQFFDLNLTPSLQLRIDLDKDRVISQIARSTTSMTYSIYKRTFRSQPTNTPRDKECAR